MEEGSEEIGKKAQEAQGVLQDVTDHSCCTAAVCISTQWGPVEGFFLDKQLSRVQWINLWYKCSSPKFLKTTNVSLS